MDSTVDEVLAENNAGCDAKIVSIPINDIDVGSRRREPDSEAVAQLKESIARQGLLQPIGVKANGNGRYGPLWGFNRLAACRELPESTILASVYSADLPDWRGEMVEIVENLHRQELTAAERDAWTLQYAALLKAHGDVAPVNKSGAATSRVFSEHSARVGVERKPTVVEKVATDLGIDKQTVHGRAARAAKSVGAKISLEKTPADTLIEVGKEAAAAARRAKGGAAPDAKVAKALLKMQKSGVLVGDIQGGIEVWWRGIHPDGQVVFTEAESVV